MQTTYSLCFDHTNYSYTYMHTSSLLVQYCPTTHQHSLDWRLEQHECTVDSNALSKVKRYQNGQATAT